MSLEPLIVKLEGKTTIVGQKSSGYNMYFNEEEMYYHHLIKNGIKLKMEISKMFSENKKMLEI